MIFLNTNASAMRALLAFSFVQARALGAALLDLTNNSRDFFNSRPCNAWHSQLFFAYRDGRGAFRGSPHASARALSLSTG